MCTKLCGIVRFVERVLLACDAVFVERGSRVLGEAVCVLCEAVCVLCEAVCVLCEAVCVLCEAICG